MSKPPRKHKFFASCPKGMEEILASETEHRCKEKVQIVPGGVHFKAIPRDALELVFQSRVASRVFKILDVYTFLNEEDLYKQAKEKWWHHVFEVNQTFKIQTLFDKDAKNRFKSSLVFSQKLKDAIADQFRDELGKRPSVNTENPNISLLLRIDRVEFRGKATSSRANPWQATISLDICGDPLSHRGYRLSGHEAPLRENLAAGIIMSTDWKKEKETFIDSMCGSGTFLAEAMLIKAAIPPTYLRIRKYIEKKSAPFAFCNQAWFKREEGLFNHFETRCQNIYNLSLDKISSLEPGFFHANDSSPKAIELSKEHLKNAYLPSEIVTWTNEDATKLSAPENSNGIIVCNPPYGERMGEKEKLENLYHQYGENLKQSFRGYRAYVLTSDQELRKKISLQTSKRIPFFNGSLECRLVKYDLY